VEMAARAVETGDIAKRLIDYGFPPYTVSFPVIVHGAISWTPCSRSRRKSKRTRSWF
jgi:glycine dehydrogenase subunit 2